jgi:uncharacterized protein YcfL
MIIIHLSNHKLKQMDIKYHMFWYQMEKEENLIFYMELLLKQIYH